MIDLMPIELMIQKTGISAYIRLKNQLATPFDTKGKETPHLQYWENLIMDYNITPPPPITDTCNTRVWEKTYNVNLESLKGGKKTPEALRIHYIYRQKQKTRRNRGRVCSI